VESIVSLCGRPLAGLATAACLTISKAAQTVEDQRDGILRAFERTGGNGGTRPSERLLEETRATAVTLATLDVDDVDREVLYRVRL
jgi:hypothetical protein